MLKTNHQRPSFEVLKMTDEEVKFLQQELDQIYQTGLGRISVLPEHLLVHQLDITLDLHTCPWCKQSVYIGRQIKETVALACPNCGGPLFTES